MIILKDECKKLNVKVADFSELVGTPVRTLQDWCIKHPKRINAYLDAVRYRSNNKTDKHLQSDLF